MSASASPISRAEAISLGRVDPAMDAYALRQRDPDAYRREAERVRILMEACLPPATPVLVTTPADDVAAAEAAFERRAARRGLSL